MNATAPGPPLHIVFEWTAREPEARFNGRGAARVEAPYRARLDLFGPRGEAYLSAAVVDGELRLPQGVDAGAIPPGPLLWSVLGVVRPPENAALVGASRDGGDARLDYERDGGRWTFVLEEGRLRRAEWKPADGGRYTVELEGDGPYGLPRRAVYRDWAAFSELTLELDEVERVEPFPPEIWTPDAP
ncbi:MAG TPA: hypothetical protein VF158_17285 [Longimicrobiales bacterium]